MAPRKSKPAKAKPSLPSTTLLLDNGAFSLKAGVIPSTAEEGRGKTAVRVIPNTVARDRHKKVYVGRDVATIRDYTGLTYRRPMEKGVIVSWEVQKEIWDAELFAGGLAVDPAETTLVLGEALGGLPVLAGNCDQIVFEEYGFAGYLRMPVSSWIAWGDIQSYLTPSVPSPTKTPAETTLVIDSGYSHTQITPLLHGRPLHSATRQLDVGGKHLTNQLTKLLSTRHYDMRNDVAIVNEIKELSSFVSLDFSRDLELCWRGPQGDRRKEFDMGSGGIAKDYVLPDFHGRMTGELRDWMPPSAGQSDGDIITLRNERFTVPEMLFSPGDVNILAPGLPELIMQSLETLPVGLWPGMLSNIIITGGNAAIPGFRERLEKELRERAPAECTVRVGKPENPVTAAWEAGCRMVWSGDVNKVVVTKAEYEEHGGAWVAKRFAGGLNVVEWE